MRLSDNQKRALEQIKEITSHFEEARWFTQSELVGIGYHTVVALVNKGILKSQYFKNSGKNINYYQFLKEVKE